MSELLVIELQDDALNRRLAEAIAGLEKPGALMNAIAAKFQENVDLRFGSKTDPAGIPWQPLAESTLERKKGAGSILEWSGLMQASLTHNVAPDGSWAEIGFGERYAGYHETGSKDGKLPRRALLTADWQAGELGAEDRADILAELDAYLAGLFE